MFSRLFAVALAFTLALPATAQTVDNGRFDVTIRGVKAGQLVFRGEQSGSNYAVAGKLASTGFVAMLRQFSYDAKSAGTVRGTRYTPSRYSETADTGKRKSSSVMRFKSGVPQVKEIKPPRAAKPYDLNPAKQGGTVDILTALYAILRDVPADQACKTKLDMFDGRRRTSIKLSNPKAAGDGLTCTGEYRRVGGFSPDDMAERTRFPFTATLTRVGDKMRVTEIRTKTTLGDAVLRRK